MSEDKFKEDYPWTYRMILSGDGNKIIEQVGLIYRQKDKALKEKTKEIARLKKEVLRWKKQTEAR